MRFFLALFAVLATVLHSALAQSFTTTDALGDTILGVVTLNQLGLPTTQFVTTIPPGQALPTTSPAATPTTTTPIPTTPDVQQGPVGQPPITTGPAPPTVYQYTTTNAAGDPVVLQDTFTPTYVQSLPPSAPASGTVLDYSSWLSLVGTNTVNFASSAQRPWHPSSHSIAIASAILSSILGGAYFVFL